MFFSRNFIWLYLCYTHIIKKIIFHNSYQDNKKGSDWN